MSTTNFKLSIETPCTTSWEGMRLTDNGRFCSQCNKNVQDLRNLTDKELVNFIERSEGVVCGRLNRRQLNRDIEAGGRRFIGANVPQFLAGFLMLFTAEHSFGKERVVERIVMKEPSDQKAGAGLNSQDSLKANFICGKILDESKSPLPGVVIRLKDKALSTTSDIDGKFKFFIPDTLLADQMLLTVGFLGFEPREILVRKEDLRNQADIVMTLEESITGEVVIVSSRKKKWISRLFRK